MNTHEGYPHNLSHFRRWIAPNQQEFMEINEVLWKRAWERTIDNIGSIDKREELIQYIKAKFTQEMYRRVIAWIILTSLDIWQLKHIDFRICNTAITLFRRYFLRRTILEAPPQILIMTCLLSAIKIENCVAEFRPPESIFNRNELERFRECVDLEPDLLNVVFYDFAIVHADSVLQAYMNAYYEFRQMGSDFTTPIGWSDCMKSKIKFEFTVFTVKPEHSDPIPTTPDALKARMVKWIEFAQNQIQGLYLILHISDMYFYHTPAIIAASVILFYLKHICGFSDAEQFIQGSLDPAIAAEPSAKFRVTEAINSAVREISELYNFLSSMSDTHDKTAIITVIKVLKRLDRLGQRKRGMTGEASDKDDKKQKVEANRVEAVVDLGYDI